MLVRAQRQQDIPDEVRLAEREGALLFRENQVRRVHAEGAEGRLPGGAYRLFFLKQQDPLRVGQSAGGELGHVVRAEGEAPSRRGHRLHRFAIANRARSEEHTSELQSQSNLVCRLLLEKKKQNT